MQICIQTIKIIFKYSFINVFGRNKISDYSEGEVTSQYFVKVLREISHALQLMFLSDLGTQV